MTVAFQVIGARVHDGRQQALVRWADGREEWRDARVAVERTITAQDGTVLEHGEVASTENGSVSIECV